VLIAVLQVMRNCWSHNPEDRPSFRVLKEQLLNVSKGLLADWLALHARLTQQQQQQEDGHEACNSCVQYGPPWTDLCLAMQDGALQSRGYSH
jgi:hypothetical protein